MTRVAAFGDAGYTDDEAFYFLVGQQAHHGLLPYVDIWDRKGPALFALTYGIAGLSSSIISLQIAGWLFATLTALLIARCADRLGNAKGSLFAGLLYLAFLPLYGGGAAQSPVFYNFPMTLAGLLAIRGAQAATGLGRSLAFSVGMASAGLAIATKLSAAFEGIFLGCFCLWRLHHSGLSLTQVFRQSLVLALCGAAPLLLFVTGYTLIGHGGLIWSAMIDANTHRTYYSVDETFNRAFWFTLNASPVLLLTLLGLRDCVSGGWRLAFISGWFCAAALGIAAMGNFFEHYTLPLLVPASIAASRAFSSERLKPISAAWLIIGLVAIGPAVRVDHRKTSREGIASMVTAIKRSHSRPRMLVYEGPIALYSLTDAQLPPSPLLFTTHLYHLFEHNSSPFDTESEMRRILAWQPEVVVLYEESERASENPATSGLVHDYARSCRRLLRAPVQQVFVSGLVTVFGNCGSHKIQRVSQNQAIK